MYVNQRYYNYSKLLLFFSTTELQKCDNVVSFPSAFGNHVIIDLDSGIYSLKKVACDFHTCLIHTLVFLYKPRYSFLYGLCHGQMFKNKSHFKNVFWGKGKHMPANCIGVNENMYLRKKINGDPST